MSVDLVRKSEFAHKLRLASSRLDSLSLRKLVFDYASLYQEVYWFDQLANAFAFLDVCGLDPAAMPDELPAVRDEVEIAIGEYFESLNEVASAIYPLLETQPFTVDDVLTSVAHIWRAHACNEPPLVFVGREDAVLCDLVSAASSHGG